MGPDESVTFTQFARKLKAMNPKVEIPLTESKASRGVMVYLKLPLHPESNPLTGLWEILAIPAPWFYKNIPKHDVEHRSIDGSGKWVRGWGTFLKAVKKMRDPWGKLIFSPMKVKTLFKRPYDKFNSQEFKRVLNDRNISPEARNYRKLRGALRAY